MRLQHLKIAAGAHVERVTRENEGVERFRHVLRHGRNIATRRTKPPGARLARPLLAEPGFEGVQFCLVRDARIGWIDKYRIAHEPGRHRPAPRLASIADCNAWEAAKPVDNPLRRRNGPVGCPRIARETSVVAHLPRHGHCTAVQACVHARMKSRPDRAVEDGIAPARHLQVVEHHFLLGVLARKTRQRRIGSRTRR